MKTNSSTLATLLLGGLLAMAEGAFAQAPTCNQVKQARPLDPQLRKFRTHERKNACREFTATACLSVDRL